MSKNPEGQICVGEVSREEVPPPPLTDGQQIRGSVRRTTAGKGKRSQITFDHGVKPSYKVRNDEPKSDDRIRTERETRETE